MMDKFKQDGQEGGKKFSASAVLAEIAEDDELVFAAEDDDNSSKSDRTWKVMIVDDEEEVHHVTQLALEDFEFEGKGLVFVNVFSAEEAREKLVEHSDVAVILLDVVMEEDDSGLKLARFVRNELNNALVRIILRTGQPGQAPEARVIVDYDINDYKEKTELTSQKLFTTLVTSLRSYRDLSIIDANRRGLERILEASPAIFKMQSMRKFASGVLTQLTSLLHLNRSALYCQTSGFAAAKDMEDEFYILAATGDYDNVIDKPLRQAVSPVVLRDLERAFQQKANLYYGDHFIIYYKSKAGSESVIYFEGLRELSEWDKNLIEIFCMNVSVAFENIYLNQEMEDTQKEIIFTIGEIAEARSQETGFHVKRVGEYSKLLALKCGLPEREAEMLRLASPMHDVGKLGIMDAILNKPDILTEQEFELVKHHAIVGHEMLKNSHRSIMQAAAIVALQHHERYDGGGYPSGLKGEDIHIYGRITAIADVFDALGCERVYKKAWPIEEILSYFREQRGKQFDPVLIDIFFANLDEILRIREMLKDH